MTQLIELHGYANLLAPANTLEFATRFALVSGSILGSPVCLIVDLVRNGGMSVTNNSESVLQASIRHLGNDTPRLWYEAYEFRIRKFGCDPDVTEVIWPGGEWKPVSYERKADLTPFFETFLVRSRALVKA